MRVLSDAAANPTRIILPIVERLPDVPQLGEMVFFNEFPHQAMMIYTNDGWLPLYSTRNNYWETHVAEPEQRIFTLDQPYDIDGHSINVYKNGVRLNPKDYAESSNRTIVYRETDEDGEDIEIEGGEIFEFQIFNIKHVKPFDVKAFNRRNGIC